TARLMGSIIDFFKLGAGIVAGHYFASNFIFSNIQLESWEFLPIMKPFAVLVCSAAAAVIFNAAKNEIIWIVGSSMIVVHSLPLFELIGTSNLAIFLSSLVAGLLSNIYAKYKNKSPSTLLLPSIVFLVPGAVGLKGLNLILDNNISTGGEQVGRSLLVAGLIVAGIFFADAVTPAVKINVSNN
ncbi:MAG: threonine/serine exporter family protein, partial [Bdellovibrionales bacterium]|nr:threonine/serine exporter family protein [Bdellovibrionales bacterium]